MYVCHILKSHKGGPAVDTGGSACAHLVRGFCTNPCRCGGCGLCDVATDPHGAADFLGTRPAIGQRSRGTVFAGGEAALCDGASVAPGRGFGRNGGRPAQRWHCCRGGRGVGCAILRGFYRHTAAGAAGRGAGCGVLVDPAGCDPRSKCRAQSVAGGIPAIGAAPGRSIGTGRSALAGGFVQIALCRPRHMGGAL